MDAAMQEARETQQDFDKAQAEVKRLSPKRNKQIQKLAKTHTKAEIAKALGLTSQRVIQILKKSNGAKPTGTTD